MRLIFFIVCLFSFSPLAFSQKSYDSNLISIKAYVSGSCIDVHDTTKRYNQYQVLAFLTNTQDTTISFFIMDQTWTKDNFFILDNDSVNTRFYGEDLNSTNKITLNSHQTINFNFEIYSYSRTLANNKFRIGFVFSDKLDWLLSYEKRQAKLKTTKKIYLSNIIKLVNSPYQYQIVK